MRMCIAAAVMCATLLGAAPAALANQGVVVVQGPVTQKGLIVKAIESPGVEFVGTLSGKEQAGIHKILGTTEPIQTHVRAIGEFDDPNCKRIRTSFSSHTFKPKLKDGSPGDLNSFYFDMSICKDGRPSPGPFKLYSQPYSQAKP